MSKFRNDVLNALIEEMEMDKADGKGIADKGVGKTAKPAEGEKETKIKLDGGGDDVGGTLPAKPPVGKVPGGEPEMKSPEGKGVAKTGGSTEEAGGGKGETMKQEGSSVAKGEVKQTKDLPKNPNVAESFVLPHEIMVEQNGKQVKLAAGTRFSIVSEAKKCEDDKCKDEKCPTHGKECNESVVKEEDENPFGGEKKEEKPAEEKPADEAPKPPTPPKAEGESEGAVVDSDVPAEEPMMDEMTNISAAGSDVSIIDRLAMSIDDLAGATGNFAADLKEFLGVEAEEPAHQEDGMVDAAEGAAEEGAELNLEAPEQGFNDADLPAADKPADDKLPF